jgi:hypothetical protein
MELRQRRTAEPPRTLRAPRLRQNANSINFISAATPELVDFLQRESLQEVNSMRDIFALAFFALLAVPVFVFS